MSWLCEDLKFEQDWYKSLIENGDEKSLIGKFIQKLFLEDKINNFLEVGMGTKPFFAYLLSSQVKNYKIVEKENLIDLLLPENTEFINDDFEKVVLKEKYDLILLSHVIYYFQNLKKSIGKAVSLLEKEGKAIFVVNGPFNDYGRLKKAFSEITNTSWTFTYDRLKECLHEFSYEEFSFESTIKFETFEDLYECTRLFFDVYPTEFNENKNAIITWMSNNIRNNEFKMDQKLIVINKL